MDIWGIDEELPMNGWAEDMHTVQKVVSIVFNSLSKVRGAENCQSNPCETPAAGQNLRGCTSFGKR